MQTAHGSDGPSAPASSHKRSYSESSRGLHREIVGHPNATFRSNSRSSAWRPSKVHDGFAQRPSVPLPLTSVPHTLGFVVTV